MSAGNWLGGPALSILLCVQKMAGQFCLQIILGASCSYFVVVRLFVLQSQDVLPSASQVPNLDGSLSIILANKPNNLLDQKHFFRLYHSHQSGTYKVVLNQLLPWQKKLVVPFRPNEISHVDIDKSGWKVAFFGN